MNTLTIHTHNQPSFANTGEYIHFFEVRTLPLPNEILGVGNGDILMVNRHILPTLGQVVLATRKENMLIGRYTEHEGSQYLVAENGTKRIVPLSTTDPHVHIWGVVIAVIKKSHGTV